MKEEKFTWKDGVRNALLELGGQGHLSEINKIVEGNSKTKTKIANNPTWQATIRRVVRQYKIFEPLEKGVYKLLEEVPVKAEPQEFTKKRNVSHTWKNLWI
jgi:hypothetical protein